MHRRTAPLAMLTSAALLALPAAVSVAPAAAADRGAAGARAVDVVPVRPSTAAAPTGTCRLPTPQTNLAEGFPVAAQALPARGELRAAMIYVDFSDAEAPSGSLPAAEENLRSGIEYLETVSGGALDVVTTSSEQWVRMPEPAADYPFQRGLSYADHVRYIEDAVVAADPVMDFSEVDVVWVVATREAEAISFSPTTNFLDVTADGQHLGHAVTFGYDQWHWGGLVLAHETGHTLGLPDLYTFAGVPDEDGGLDYHSFAGGWDVMGLISGRAPELLAWHRWMLQWVDDEQVACLDPDARTATVELTAVEAGGGTAMAVLPLSDTRALVVESRRALRYDHQIAQEGALVYTVDTTVPTGSGPVEVHDTTPGSALDKDDATLTARHSWTDPESGTTVRVVRSTDRTDTVQVRPGRG
ncbi:M6 family metalloprotease domain-containing protein [Desertihabitans brevis]|uniref:M6 family metalloprotease domain-containing protein n=1 Tax=Desertihabitans brevis TaxID=2268447 RepID=A0A367YUU5_9ACTN|nr:M6 family metalloprotease domain-containing protein [Desertihabitans brevis]RCK68792.1 M6 family metalloprotease domain-containing protein [Desertihabitans brevis]